MKNEVKKKAINELSKELREIYNSVVLRFGSGEQPKEETTRVCDIRAKFNITQSQARRKLNKLVEKRLLKKSSYHGYASVYWPR